MQQMIDSLKSLPSKPKIFLCTPIKAFKQSFDINDSVIVNGITPIIYKLAKKNKLSVIDLHTLFGTDDTFVLSDGIHPNDKGAAKMAEIIAGEIQRNKSK
jgi:lysophospholipase L1-like esterase